MITTRNIICVAGMTLTLVWYTPALAAPPGHLEMVRSGADADLALGQWGMIAHSLTPYFLCSSPMPPGL